MVKAISGVLIRCDESVRQLILLYDEREKCVVCDLDERHLFVDAKSVDKIRYFVESQIDTHAYKLDVLIS